MLCGDTFTALYRKSVDELQLYDKRELETLHSELRRTLLATAVNRNDTRSLKKFLQLGLKQEVDKGEICATRSPLITAIRLGNAECLRLLLEKDNSGIKCQRYRDGVFIGNPYMLFMRHLPPKNDCEIARLLVKHGAIVTGNIKNSFRNLGNRPDLMKVLLDGGLPVHGCVLSEVLPNKDQYGCKGRMAVIRLLIEYGVDLSLPWYLSFTCANNKLNVAKLLLDYTPTSVLRRHDSYLHTQPALTKCFNPVCSVIYTMFEFQDHCLYCLKLLLRANVVLYPKSTADPNCSGHLIHRSPFDQFLDIRKANSSFLETFRVLLEYGVSFHTLLPFIQDSDVQTLMQEGYCVVKSLQMIARDVVRRQLGPGKDTEAKIQSLPVPVLIQDILCLKGVLDLPAC